MNDTADSAAISDHPLANDIMTGAETVVQVLADEGVDTVFGYSGGAILPIYDAVFRYNDKQQRDDRKESMRLVVPANEQGAAAINSAIRALVTQTGSIEQVAQRVGVAALQPDDAGHTF